jgi:putative PIN family toxin of toxin-antitoxin system
LRVVLDTNVVVSGLAYPDSPPGRIVRAWRQGAIQLVLSRHILAEIARVLPRLRPRLTWSDADILDFLDLLALLADLVEPTDPAEEDLRDVDDLPVLGTLLAAGADVLVTGDKDLLSLAPRYSIVTPAEFCQRTGL